MFPIKPVVTVAGELKFGKPMTYIIFRVPRKKYNAEANKNNWYPQKPNRGKRAMFQIPSQNSHQSYFYGLIIDQFLP